MQLNCYNQIHIVPLGEEISSMTIELIKEPDGTLNSEDFELDLMITRPNTSTTSCGMNIGSINDLRDGFELFEEYGCKSIGLTCWLPDTNICFKELPYIDQVRILKIDFNAKKNSLNLLSKSNTTPKCLIELKLLSEKAINFNQFHLLNELRILNVSHQKKSESWMKHKGIIDLTILKYSHANLTPLANMKSLKRLKITQGSLSSLKGIEKLKNLETLHIYDLKKLTSLDSLLESPSIKNLIFESYTKTTDWDFLSKMKQLRQLNLSTSTSLKFTSKLPNLIFLHCKKVIDKDRKPELIVEQRAEKLNLLGLPLPGFIPLFNPLTYKIGNP